MKTGYRIVLLLLVAAGAFLTGSLVTYYGGNHKSTAERKILYYVDPMNPAFKSAKPGIAPCGMALEPVYADKISSGLTDPGVQASAVPGSIYISTERQQLIGVKVMNVEKSPWTYTMRVLGRVTPDEALVYVINSSVEGWIRAIYDNSTGSIVKENEILASFYSPEFLSAEQAYIYALGSLDRFSADSKEPPQQIELTNKNVKQYEDALRNIGMSELQIAEIRRTRQYTENIQLRSPAKGFVTVRNVTTGLRFEKGKELYRIADLSRVWILADVFENEASFFRPGQRVKIELPYQKRSLYAQMSNVLPQFDPATRTLRIRLKADNPGYVMRPDMFVNVELPMSGPPAIIIPTDAVVDSGLRKTVFVDHGNGYFEPRQLETGRLLGDRVEVTRGLMPGEKIVVAGNFLIDSESRMQQAALGITEKAGRDLICGMNIDEDRSKAAGFMKTYQGKEYFFCSTECRDEFAKTPQRYLSSAATQVTVSSLQPKVNIAIDHPAHDAGKMIPPKGDSPKTGQKMKTTDGGHNHD